jgi:hypothetical protein
MKTEDPNRVNSRLWAATLAILAGALAGTVPLYAQGAKVS